MGGDDPRRMQQDPNVIIPDIGAGKYWYVDPSAGVAQQPAQVYDPMADTRSNLEQLKLWGEQPESKTRMTPEEIQEVLRRLGVLPEGTQPSF